MASLKTTRRQFIRLGVATFAWSILEPWVWETRWLKIKQLNIGGPQASHRIVHITDIHHKGDRAYLKKVVETVNALSPDFVAFTGDLVEDSVHLDEALDVLSQIKYPVYGVPGNHDFGSGVPFKTIAQFCESTGGAWLLNQDRITKDGTPPNYWGYGLRSVTTTAAETEATIVGSLSDFCELCKRLFRFGACWSFTRWTSPHPSLGSFSSTR